MTLETVTNLVPSELFIVSSFLWTIGFFLKKHPGFRSEWAIPYILLSLSFLMTIPYLAIVYNQGFTWDTVINGVLQAPMVAALAVFSNELKKQFFDKRVKDKSRLSGRSPY